MGSGITFVQVWSEASHSLNVPSLQPEASLPSESHVMHLTAALWPLSTACVALGRRGHE